MAKIFDEAGELILGTRFKKLGDKYLDNVSEIYKKTGVEFEPSWFAIFYILDKHGKLTMSEIASNLGLSQSAISQIVSTLEKKQLIKIDSKSADKRIKIISLTEDAKNLIDTIKPIWHLIKQKMREMLDEGEYSKNMLQSLKELENAFRKKSLAKRVLENIENSEYVVERYQLKYFFSIKKLIFSWIYDYGLPFEGLINNLKEILKTNETYAALANKNIESAALIIKKNGYFDMFLFNKRNFNGKADSVLIEHIFKNFRNNNHTVNIYVDSGDHNIKTLLKKYDFRYKKTTRVSKELKSLDVFEGVL